MGQMLSYLKSYFEKSPQTPIDYSAGKSDKTKYFQEILPDIRSNLDISKKFVDPIFPHDINAIFNKYNPLYKKILKKIEKKKKKIILNVLKADIFAGKEFQIYLKISI